MIIGVGPCRHAWRWHGDAAIKCSKCNEEQSGHARDADSSKCLTCNKNH